MIALILYDLMHEMLHAYFTNIIHIYRELEEVKEEDYEAIENEASATPGTSKKALREDDTIDFDSRYQLKDYDDEDEEEGRLGCAVV